MARTKHTCGGPVFGRKTPGCPRCDELLSGAEPRKGWDGRTTAERRQEEERSLRWLRDHNCTRDKCGPVCTHGDW